MSFENLPADFRAWLQTFGTTKEDWEKAALLDRGGLRKQYDELKAGELFFLFV